MKRIFATQAALALVFALPAAAGTGIATGFNVLDSLDDAELAAEMADYAGIGAEWLRTDLNWSVVQAEGRDSWDWRAMDRIVVAAQAAGLRVLPVVSFAPDWAWKGGEYSAPADPADYARFLKAAVTRYSAMHLHHWEIWNEPNLSGPWPHPDPVAYARLLKAAYPAVKATDPDAVVITGGLASVPMTDFFGRRDYYGAVSFLRTIYAEGAGDSFDAVGFHPYSYPHLPAEGQGGWAMMTGPIRDLMVQNGDAEKPVWITEFGAPTQGGDRAMSEADQAESLRQAADALDAFDWAGPVFWYGYRDLGNDTGDTEDWFGLVAPDGREKPVAEVFRTIAGR